MPLDHMSLAVPYAKLEAEVAFLAASLAPLGITEKMRPHPAVVGMGDTTPFLWVSGVDLERNHLVEQEGKGAWKVHIAFSAKDRAQVDEFHKKGLETGGTCNGKPGVRAHYHPNYYGAFVLDPCGNNIEAVAHAPPSSAE